MKLCLFNWIKMHNLICKIVMEVGDVRTCLHGIYNIILKNVFGVQKHKRLQG